MKSGIGAGSNDLEELAALGNFGRNSGHVAGQLTTKYCKDDSMLLPLPYFFECPVQKKSPDSWYMAKETVAIFCHMNGFLGWKAMTVYLVPLTWMTSGALTT